MRNKVKLRVSLSLMALAFLAIVSEAGALQAASDNMDMPSVAPLFIENETFSSTVSLVNEAQTGGWLQLTLFDLDGNQIVSVPEYFGPVSDRTFRVRDLLNDSGMAVAAGSLQFAHVPTTKSVAVLGQVSITHYQAGTYAYLDEEFVMSEEGGSNILRAVVDGSRRYAAAALTNTGNRPLTATVACTGGSGSPNQPKCSLETL